VPKVPTALVMALPIGGHEGVASARGCSMTERKYYSGERRYYSGGVAGGAIYSLGVFGAWVYFWQQSDAFWEFVWGFFQGILWPAFMVYELFVSLGD